MLQLKYSGILVLAVLRLAIGQDLAALPDCGRTCYTNMEGQGGALGCADESIACLCGKPDYQFGINDCAKGACGADVAPTVSNWLVAMCATAVAAPATQAPTVATPVTTDVPTPTPAPTTAPEQPVTSAAPTTTQPQSQAAESPVTQNPATSSPPAVETTPTPSSTPAESTQSPTTLVTSAAPIPTTSTTSTTSSKSTKTSTSTSSTSSGATAAADAKSSDPATKISQGAIVGIAVGGAAALVVVAVLFLMRRRHVKRQHRRSAALLSQLKISEPMPGSGRSYADSYHSPGDGYPSPPRRYYPGAGDGVPASNELEMRSRRYEDMVPRVAPKLIN